MTQLYSDAMPEEAIEGMIDFATAVAKVVDNFGLFQGALSSLGVVGGAKIISTIASNWTGLLSAITSPLGIGTIAVGGAVAAISAYQKSVSEMVESAKQAGDEWESGQENLQGQIDKISELRTALDSGTLSEQEAASAKSELLSIQESLSESYGSQVAGIDLVNGSLTEQIALLDKVSAKEAERFQNENEKGIDKATKEIEKERHEYLGQFYDNGTQESEDIKKSIKDLQDKYGDDVFTTELEADGITMDLHFNADASTAREALNDFKTDISDIKKQYGESDVLNLLGDNASAGLSKANKVLDEYGDLYNQAQKAKLVADDDTYKAPSGKEQTAVKWLNDETKAVEAYNDALSEGNSDAIKQALDSAKEKQTNLIDALGNSRSATGLTKDDINNVTSAFKDLDNFDPASIFEETATGVHLNTQALKEYASGIMRVPNDQLAWTQEQGEEAIVRNDGSILTPLSRDVSVLNADMTKNLWDFMGNPGSFLSDYSDGFVNSEKYSTKNEESNVNIASVFDNVTFNLPNVIDSQAFVRELVTNKKAERAIQAMTIDRIRGGSSLAKYKYKH